MHTNISMKNPHVVQRELYVDVRIREIISYLTSQDEVIESLAYGFGVLVHASDGTASQTQRERQNICILNSLTVNDLEFLNTNTSSLQSDSSPMSSLHAETRTNMPNYRSDHLRGEHQ